MNIEQQIVAVEEEIRKLECKIIVMKGYVLELRGINNDNSCRTTEQEQSNPSTAMVVPEHNI